MVASTFGDGRGRLCTAALSSMLLQVGNCKSPSDNVGSGVSSGASLGVSSGCCVANSINVKHRDPAWNYSLRDLAGDDSIE